MFSENKRNKDRSRFESKMAATYQNVTNSVSRFFAAVDNKDWDGASEFMASPIHMDYCWARQKTWNQRKILTVTIGSSTSSKVLVKTCVQCVHYLAEAKKEGTEEISPPCVVYGNYSIELISTGDHTWKIFSLTLQYKFSTGNTALPNLAREKVLQNDALALASAQSHIIESFDLLNNYLL